ncbi:MAG: prolyl oligopeptidase family serine peptidase [Hyphomonadaceae bacterium]
MKRVVVLLGLVMALPACTSLDLKASQTGAEWTCPEGFTPHAGLNVGFPSDGMKRAFVIVPAKGVSGPAPVWVPLTGTVESTNANLNVARSGANGLMADKGFTVIAPVRQCADQNPDIGFKECDGVGSNGWNWKPWNDGRAGSSAGDVWKNDAGPDSRFFEAMVRCAGTAFSLDRSRLFLGGISAGGTVTNRALTFNSDFWAGGMPISGEWYVANDDGSTLSFNEARAAVAANPTKIFQGRIGPSPLHKKLSPMIVITVWGGEKDLWDCGPPLGLCSDYRPSTQAGANYFSSMPNVVHVACSAGHGHMWPQVNTQAFNLWALTTLASHPKGTDPKAFKLTPPPEGYSCKLGAFKDHYTQ